MDVARSCHPVEDRRKSIEGSDHLNVHTIVLREGNLVLRPPSEADGPLAMHFDDDARIGPVVGGDDSQPQVLEMHCPICRSATQHAFCFVIEQAGRPISGCRLQQMNLRRLTGRWPNLDLRRIDLVIRDESAWDRGGTAQAIRMLTQFAFDRERADAIFGCDISERDSRSLRAVREAGYMEEVRWQAPAQMNGKETIDMVIWRNPAPGAGLPVNDPYLTEAEVLDCLRLLNRALSVPFWIGGGVGVDLLVGRLTRPHGDIDLCIDRRHRALAFAEFSRAGFRVTKDLGWHTRWSRSSRVIGELDVCFTTIHPGGSTTLIICPEDGIGEPGRYPGPPGTFDEQRYGAIVDVRCRIESAESQVQLRQGYRALFPGAAEDAKVRHDLELLTSVIGPDPAATLAIAPLHREDLLPGDCGD